MNLRRIATGAGALLLAAALTACGGSDAPSTKAAADGTPPAATTDKPKAAVGKVKVVYGEVSKNQDLEPIKQSWEQDKSLETLADEITTILNLPSDITLAGQECGAENAFWQPDEKMLVLCYEIEPWFANTFKDTVETAEELEDKSGSAAIGIFFHELGHAAVSLYDLPITGKEEDAVDQLATVLLAGSGNEALESSAVDFAEFWGLLGTQETEAGTFDFADEHSTSDQRYYNIMCWVVGSNPDKYSNLVGPAEDGLLPEARAERCPGEWEQIQKAWSTLLQPHLNNA